MEGKINYTLVGLFVLILLAIGIIIPLWLTTKLNQQEYLTYTVYMNEAVDGLLQNAVVNYNGVEVGRVKQIQLNPKNTEQVILLLDITSGTPITTNTTATLKSQGITGIAYIGLSGGKNTDAKILTALPGEQYPRIKALPSIRVRLDTALTTLMTDLNTLNKQLSNLISPENSKAISDILNNLNKITLNFSKHDADIDKSLSSLNNLLTQLSQTSQNFPNTSNEVQEILKNMRTLSEELKQNPSVVIRGKTSPSLGPGESQ